MPHRTQTRDKPTPIGLLRKRKVHEGKKRGARTVNDAQADDLGARAFVIADRSFALAKHLLGFPARIQTV